MDFYQIILIVLAVLGVGLVFAAGFLPADEEEETVTESGGLNAALSNYVGLAEKMRGIDSSIAEADNVITELHDVSSTVFKEIDGKYQELLYLYNLIDEKKRLLAEEAEVLPERSPVRTREKDEPFIDMSAVKELLVATMPPEQETKKPLKPAKQKDKKTTEILQLFDEGFSEADIAQIMEIGRAETALILSLNGKGGQGVE